MGRKDLVTFRYFEDRARYADLINGFTFGGRQVVKPKDVEEWNPHVTGSDMRGALPDRAGKKAKNRQAGWQEKAQAGTQEIEAPDLQKKTGELRQRFRDGVRKVVFGSSMAIIGLEHQSEVHYAMPVRVMAEDAMEYDRQLREYQRRHRRKRDLRGAEYLSGLGKSEHLLPVITIVLYYGEKPWDGTLDVRELAGREALPEELSLLVNGYRLHVLDVRRFEGSDRFRTDLREVFGFLQRADEKEELRRFTEERREAFEHLDEDAYDMIAELTGSQELRQGKEENREGRTINMCKGIRDMIEDGREEGREEGAGQINQLTLKLAGLGRMDDIVRAAGDRGYQGKLLREFGL